MTDYKQLVTQKLLEIKAIKLNPTVPFTWASGLKSPIYCDNRISLSYPEARDLIKEALKALSLEFGHIDVIAGVATAGIPHGVLLADALQKPFIYVRSQPKEHGRKNSIEGQLNSGQNVLIVEDLISTGGSCLQVADILKEAGCKILGVIAIFSYDLEKAHRNFINAQCKFKSLTNYKTLLEEAVKGGYISNNEVDALTNWSKDPDNWNKI
jgi:orotate phosphoribosyltransferase